MTSIPSDPEFLKPGGRSGALDDSLRKAFEEGVGRHGPLPLAFEDFAAHVIVLVAQRLNSPCDRLQANRVARVVDDSVGCDLFLAIACDKDVPGAWETFSRTYFPRLRGLARKHRVPDSDAEELIREIPGELVAEPGKAQTRTRLGTYQGIGPLFDWLAVIFLRKAVHRTRRKGFPLGAGDGDPRGREAGESPILSNPLANVVDRETCQRFDAALSAAWERLQPEELVAITYKYGDGLAQKDIARILHCGEWRVSRVLDRGLRKIREVVRRMMRQEGQVEGDQLWSALRETLETRLQISTSASHQPVHGPSRHEKNI